MLTINFLGKPTIEYNGCDITEKFGNKTLALLCLLVLNRDKYLNREKIITYLWPDSNEEAAKYNLRFNLWTIKKNIGDDETGNNFLYVDRERCKVNSDYDYNCDIVLMRKLENLKNCDASDIEKIKGRFCGDFMEGFYFKNCNDFNEVIIFERGLLEDCKVHLLMRLVDDYEKKSDISACNTILKEIMKLEPYDEEIALKIMELYEKEDKRSSAVIFYNKFKSRLMSCLGIQPSEKLVNKYHELRECSLVAEESFKITNQINHKKRINLETECIKCIKFFWISEVIGKLAKQGNISLYDYIGENQISDLSYIQPEIKELTDIEVCTSEIPDVRIVTAFCKLLISVSDNYKLEIQIHNASDMDDFSLAVYKYLRGMDTNIDMMED